MVIQLTDVTKRYDNVESPAISGVSFGVAQGELVALLGPSGCGKSTLLRLIAGLEIPNSGEIWLEGRSVSSARTFVKPEARRIGLIFQDAALFPHLTVRENVAFGVHNSRDAKERVNAMLHLVELDGLDLRYPHELSGGQQQRVALARALAPGPATVLLDEPFANLDAALRNSLRADVRRILKQAGATVVLVTHDQEEALSMADRIAVLMRGRLQQIASPREIYLRPASRDLATFVGDANFLPGAARGALVDCALGAVTLLSEALGPVDVMIRPEAIQLTPSAAGAAIVEAITYYGHDAMIAVRLSDTLLRARISALQPLRIGERVDVRCAGVAVAFPSA